MSLAALIELAKKIDEETKANFNGRKPITRTIIGYSKGHWLVQYTFKETYGHSSETRWEQDARSIQHQMNYPND